jgi:hypothetical protein
MPHYLVAIHLPDGYDGSLEGEAIVAGPTAATSAPFPVPESSPPHRPRAKYPVSSILGHTKKH